MQAARIERAVPAVVVGESLNSLGVIRSLSGAGMPLYVVATTRWCPSGCSRFARLVRLPSLQGEALIDGLQALGTALGGRPVLMLGGDCEVDTVNEHRSRLEPLFRFTLPPADVVRNLANKALFQRFAEEHGLPVPRTAIIQSEEALRRLGELVLPLVIKPADKVQVLNGKVDRAVRVDAADEALVVAARMLAGSGSVIAQEWIDGDDTDIFFALFVCDRDGRSIAMFCGRKLVCDPPEVGSTGVCCAAGAEAPELSQLTEHFIAESGYQGIGSLEFKRDRRSGRFVIVEPTVGRTDWQEEIATFCGINLPLQSYLCDVGLPPRVETPSARATSAWSSSIFHRVPRGMLPAGVRVRDGYLRLDDPLPGLHHYVVDEFARRLARRIGRFLRIPRRDGPSLTIDRSHHP